MMNEQTGATKDAADNYEQAWKYSRKNQPSIGNIFLLNVKFRENKVQGPEMSTGEDGPGVLSCPSGQDVT